MSPPPDDTHVARRGASAQETAGANRTWWDDEADDYYLEHGAFLGDTDFVWGPERLREAEAGLLGDPNGSRMLEIGAGSGQCSRWLSARRATVVATDLSRGMVATGVEVNEHVPEETRVPFVQCDGRMLPFADSCFDTVFTAYGVLPFVADSDVVLREAARVLRAGGRFVFATTHPMRWAFPDDPGPNGLTVYQSYFDRTPYVEQDDDGRATYVEHHRTLGDRVREIRAAGLVLDDLVEPEWPEGHDEPWGAWSPLRGRLFPGTAIFVCHKPR
ncbi:SAM-dependent methyltransferase [Humibacillus sp. DSM 29435]|uniref:class I SAM-dependent methyltransferase n=1 Tax=Humibacillus sp. DSM 29435 TaxID=1869167 RepID=UPI0008722E32|nr:class I SAM-dependent methyltransferase [Humibacillus sp. DSM 29435]OFE17686.1 SAM-dependent methyltransferase [Humibacillus sp. DSM 29435]